MKITEAMKTRRLFFDGGMGSLLQEKGLQAGELPERWNLTHPQEIREIHRSYLQAGADILTTNTFGANILKFSKEELEKIVTAAVSHAKEAVKAEGHGYVALDMGPTGKLLKPLGDLEFEDAVSLYKEVARLGTKAGADLILIETMSDSYELKAAVLGAKEGGISLETGECLPVFATVIFDGKGKLLTGGTPASVVALLEGLRVDALGINCGLGPVQMKEFAGEILRVSSLPVIVNPNAGLPRSEGGKTVYDIDAAEFARAMEEIVNLGAVMTGGCCGTTPEHIREMVKRCKDIPVVMPEPKRRTVVSSYSQAVEFDKKTVIIGERINPTGKPRFKQALLDGNMEYLLREAVTQQDNGADVLDVNVGLPGIDEPALLETAVKEIQGVTGLPLQLDTANIEAMERALRVYNGKALINSVNGKKEVMEQIFPLAAKYGGVIVGLCLDEDGIPETAEGRIRVGQKILDTAASYGIGPEDIILDGLCMTVSSDRKGALITLETLRRIKNELGVPSVLGVSNISFGLPKRELINSAFFTMAMECGLGAAIINPNSEAMMNAYYSFNALMDRDEQCFSYIDRYGKIAEEPKKKAETPKTGNVEGTLYAAVLSGLKEGAKEAAALLLKEKNPLEIIQGEMVPALDEVGKGFEKGTLFLPQLLMSAEAAKAAFEEIKNTWKDEGGGEEKEGLIILATVKGDIHDIGKNIVKVLLENYSYEVLDLGKDVAPETIVEETAKRKVKLVGLSALMTTTVPSMEATIKLLREKAPWAKVMVGGAVLTKDYAKTIGADAYCRDAMASVNYAKEVFANKTELSSIK